MRQRYLIATALTAILSVPANADTLTIAPGLWEFTSTSTNSMTGQTQSQTEKQCLKEPKAFDPVEMTEGMDDCNMVENKRQGDKLTFRMDCNMQGSTATATGKLHTDGKTSQMDMEFLIKAGTMDMKMTMQSKGKRLGDC